MAEESEPRIAIVTPSYAPDFASARALNESVLAYFPAHIKHYLVVDASDLALFRALENSRTIVAAVEDVVPAGFFKLPFPKKWWFSTSALRPVKGWLVQQVAKLSMARVLEEQVVINVDSDVRFIRPVDPALFTRDGKTRLYRLPGGITEGMQHVRWHRNLCRMLDFEPDPIPQMNDYVGNVISWNRRNVHDACQRLESQSGRPWYVPFAQAQHVSEYMMVGLYVEKLAGPEAARMWIDERSWCHTYWGPAPLPKANVDSFVAQLPDDDVAFSIAGYTKTDPRIVNAATQLVLQRAAY